MASTWRLLTPTPQHRPPPTPAPPTTRWRHRLWGGRVAMGGDAGRGIPRGSPMKYDATAFLEELFRRPGDAAAGSGPDVDAGALPEGPTNPAVTAADLPP